MIASRKLYTVIYKSEEEKKTLLMSVEEFKKRLLDQLTRESKELKPDLERYFKCKLPFLPIEILESICVERLVGVEPFVYFQEIKNVFEAKNEILAIWVSIRFFGRPTILILKCMSDEKLNLSPLELPEIHDVNILLEDIDKKGKPKRNYIDYVEIILRWAPIVLDLFEKALKKMSGGV